MNQRDREMGRTRAYETNIQIVVYSYKISVDLIRIYYIYTTRLYHVAVCAEQIASSLYDYGLMDSENIQ